MSGALTQFAKHAHYWKMLGQRSPSQGKTEPDRHREVFLEEGDTGFCQTGKAFQRKASVGAVA